MRSETQRLRKIAERLLAVEAGASGSAAFAVCEKLRRPLARLAGAAGYRTLLARALALAGEKARWLKAVHVTADGSLNGIEEVKAQLPDDELVHGEAALIAELIGLLVTFIGEALTLRLTQEVWPEISMRDFGHEPENEDG